MVAFTDTVYWADTAARLVMSSVFLGFTLHAVYLWRGKPTSRMHTIRVSLLMSGRILNMVESLDFYGVKFFPPELSLFTVALQTGGDLLCCTMFALAWFTVMLHTAKFNRKVKMAVPHMARVIMLCLCAIFNIGCMACVILAVASHSPSPAVGIQRILTGVCTSGCIMCTIYIIVKVIVLIDTEGAVNARRKFVRMLFFLVPAALAILGQQLQSAADFIGPLASQSAHDYRQFANDTRPPIDSYYLFAVIDDRDAIVTTQVEYGFSWFFAAILRLAYIPMVIFAAYPTSANSVKQGSRPSTTHSDQGRPSTIDEPPKKNSAIVAGKLKRESLLNEEVDIQIALAPMTPKSPIVTVSTPKSPTITLPTIVVPDTDQPISRPVTSSPDLNVRSLGSSPSVSLVAPSEHPESQRSSFLETPREPERRVSDPHRHGVGDQQRPSGDGQRRPSGEGQRRRRSVEHEVSRPQSPNLKSSISSMSPHGGHSREASPRKPISRSNSHNYLPSLGHSGHIRLVDEDEQVGEAPLEAPERKPANVPREDYQRLDDL